MIIKESDFTRIGFDINGNSRYVLHYLKLSDSYQDAGKLANLIGGRKYNGKKFPVHLVFQGPLHPTVTHANLLLNGHYTKLMRTNSKEYRERVFKYLMDGIDFEGYPIDPKTKKEKINALFTTFKNEFCYPYNMQRYPSEQTRLTTWLTDLPSCISIAFTYGEILELVKKLHGIKVLAPKQKKPILSRYWGHMAHMLIKLKEKHNK